MEEMEAKMAAWMKYSQPGEGHRFLEKLTGIWEARTQFWMQPGAPPKESVGTSVNELTLGGRFLKSEYASEFMGSAFQGLALDGFDNQKQKYVGLWTDTMSTLMLVFEGTCNDEGTVRTMIANFTDAASGKPAKMKGVTTVVSDDEHRYEAWNEGPGGDLFKSMEVVYKRK
jgi:hypothetical protein